MWLVNISARLISYLAKCQRELLSQLHYFAKMIKVYNIRENESKSKKGSERGVRLGDGVEFTMPTNIRGAWC